MNYPKLALICIIFMRFGADSLRFAQNPKKDGAVVAFATAFINHAILFALILAS